MENFLDEIEVRETLALNLLYAREAAQLTQEQLAVMSGVSRSTINQLENVDGNNNDCKLSKLIKITNALKISPICLFLGEDEINTISNIDYKELNKIFTRKDTEAMQRHLVSKAFKKKKSCADLGATIAHSAGLSACGAALGSMLLPGIGTILGASLGSYISTRKKTQ